MDRRSALKNIGVSFGSITISTGVLSIIQSCQTNDLNWTPKFFTAKRIGFMDRMLEIIIPETDTPGAISLNLSKFIDAHVHKNISSKNQSELNQEIDEFMNFILNNENKKTLNKGLDALLGNQDQKQRSIKDINIEQIKAGRFQPRSNFDKQKLNELTNSIKNQGVLSPILVRELGLNEYEVIAGERRWSAAQVAQLHEIPAVIRSLDDVESLEIAIIENVQRADLSPIEEAAGYKKLMENYGHTQEVLSEIVGKSRSHVANIIRLLSLPNSIQDMISQGSISSGHVRAIMNSAFPEQLAEKIINENL